MPRDTEHPRQVDSVVGGQYGSEGKGNLAGALVDRYRYANLVRVAGPNAGHTTYTRGDQPRGFALRTIPAACVRDFEANLYIGPGSEIEFAVLEDEVHRLEAAGIPVRGRLFVHPQATIITPHHQELESRGDYGEHGSTKKGIGAARAERAMRRAPLAGENTEMFTRLGLDMYTTLPLDNGRTMIEGTQGYWLGLHAGLYPYCTSSDCRTIDFLAMAGITNWGWCTSYVLFRTHPIRIAGPSGGLRNEISWEELSLRTGGHVKPEKTTVTKLIRRVGELDPLLVGPAVEGNRMGSCSRVIPVLMFADYWEPRMYGVDDVGIALDTLPDAVTTRAKDMLGDYYDDLGYVATGPNTGIWIEGSEDA